MDHHPSKNENIVNASSASAEVNSDQTGLTVYNSSSVYLIRIPIWVALFILEHWIEDFLGVHLWSGFAILASLVVTYLIERIKNIAVGSIVELRVSFWLYNQIPWIVAAILIYLAVNRYLYDVQHP